MKILHLLKCKIRTSLVTVISKNVVLIWSSCKLTRLMKSSLFQILNQFWVTQRTAEFKIDLIFLQDYITYWFHRLFHTPWLYKNFHKLHHTYKQPTAFSVTAIHPVEFVMLQCIYISPMLTIPIHWSKYTEYIHTWANHCNFFFATHTISLKCPKKCIFRLAPV